MNSLAGIASVWKACLCILVLVALTCFSVTQISAAPSLGVLQIEVDCDSDGIPNDLDPDDDNDGVPDARDSAPCNPAIPGKPAPEGNSSTNDADGDGIPDDLDPDDGRDTSPYEGNSNGRPSTDVPLVASLPSTGTGSSDASIIPLAAVAAVAVSRSQRK